MKVNEIFGPTIQGEGKSLGDRVIFLRLSRCNLACIWCDTPETWNWEDTLFKHPRKFDSKKEIHEMSYVEIMAELKRLGSDVKKIVISGGEPMLQQDKLIVLLMMLKLDGYLAEIETNGTIEPRDEFLEIIDQINCSPKTSNSGEDNTLEMRERPEALKKLVANEKTNFKFVVSGEGDLPEIEDFISRYGINKNRVYLMPQAQTREEYFAIDIGVQRVANDHELQFTSRLQMYYWGNKRGH